MKGQVEERVSMPQRIAGVHQDAVAVAAFFLTSGVQLLSQGCHHSPQDERPLHWPCLCVCPEPEVLPMAQH